MLNGEKLAELRRLMEHWFSVMDHYGLVLHWAQVDDILVMADILGIDLTTLPTEERRLEIERGLREAS